MGGCWVAVLLACWCLLVLSRNCWYKAREEAEIQFNHSTKSEPERSNAAISISTLAILNSRQNINRPIDHQHNNHVRFSPTNLDYRLHIAPNHRLLPSSISPYKASL
ncbi:hypothetical protein L2E82_05070 [Cichorium intybus]|uniref:Uncharacterized protein n=1 Tax=Cichorium intybus TaxID=13427 RepID=A0ACB9H7K8_CICIN|nr:hypothetical protein L2E82_05070 [Cichorium intybus]